MQNANKYTSFVRRRTIESYHRVLLNEKSIPSHNPLVAGPLVGRWVAPIRDWVDQPGFSSDLGHGQVLDGAER